MQSKLCAHHAYARPQMALLLLGSQRPNSTTPNGSAPLPPTRRKAPPKRQQTSRRLSDLAASLPRLALAAIGAAALVCGPAGASDGGGGGTARYPCENVASYYAGTEGLEGAELMRRLSGIVSGQRSSPYRKVWDALKILDAANIDDPENSSDVIEIYSLRAVPKELAGKPEGWNREHLWPRSYGLIDGPAFTDLHNIRPADANVNSSRGNKYFGECTSESTSCVQPADIEAAPDTETDRERWTPPLKVRGDIARSLMYMAVRYGWSEQPEGIHHLQLSDFPSTKNREMGLLSTLLKWNALDPPSREEQLRNDRICSLYQQNRNPFVDHPEFADLLWSNSALVKPLQYSLKAWINEFHYNNRGKDDNEFIEIAVGPSVDASKIEVLFYNGANGQVYGKLLLKDERRFSISRDESGFSLYTAFLPIQNGPADGIALVSMQGNNPEILQFLSYGGTVQAANGAAKGFESIDIQIQETQSSSKLNSIGLVGNQSEGFMWKKLAATPGKLNIGQRF